MYNMVYGIQASKFNEVVSGERGGFDPAFIRTLSKYQDFGKYTCA